MGKTSTDCRCITERISPFDGEKASRKPAAVDDRALERAIEELACNAKLGRDLPGEERLELGAPHHRIAGHDMAKPLVAPRKELRDVANRHLRVVVETREKRPPCAAAGVGIRKRRLRRFDEEPTRVVHRSGRRSEPAHERRLPGDASA